MNLVFHGIDLARSKVRLKRRAPAVSNSDELSSRGMARQWFQTSSFKFPIGLKYIKNCRPWKLGRYLFYSITISRTFQVIEIPSRQIAIKDIYRDSNKNRNCEWSQKFHKNKIRPVFSAFRSEKQKRTTWVVSWLFDHKRSRPHTVLFLSFQPLKETFSELSGGNWMCFHFAQCVEKIYVSLSSHGDLWYWYSSWASTGLCSF